MYTMIEKILSCRVTGHESLGCERTGSDNASDKRQNCRLSCCVKLSFHKINGNRRMCTHRTRATKFFQRQATKFKIFIISCVRCCNNFVACRSLCVHTLSMLTKGEEN